MAMMREVAMVELFGSEVDKRQHCLSHARGPRASLDYVERVAHVALYNDRIILFYELLFVK